MGLSKGLIAAGIAAASFAGCARAAEPPRRPVQAATFQDDLARCYQEQASLLPFSGVVLVERGGDSFVRTVGSVDAGDTIPIARDSRFRLASVQKVLTQVAIGQLVDRGLIDLDAPVGRYVQGLPSEVAAVTIDQLIQHRSGVASFTRMDPPMMDALLAARSARDLVPLVASRPLEFRPGQGQGYSNGGYWLLGAVIESVTGKEYGQHLEEALFRPLGMSATGLVSGPETVGRRTKMVPGQPPTATFRPVRPPQEPRGTPSGDGVSTADDMVKLGRALLGNRLLSDRTKARLFLRRAGEPWRFGQSGGNIGTSTDFAVYPESGLISIVLSNYDPPTGDAMGRVLRQAALGEGCRPLRESDVPGPQRRPPPPGGANPAQTEPVSPPPQT
jgi:CubicO group peptidase (beta-lactamase class C family)